MLKQYQWRILVRVVLLLVTLSATAFLLVQQHWAYLIITLPVISYQIYDFFRFHVKAQREVEQFVESVHYRDFSRYFDVNHAPLEIQPLRKGFNEINDTFKDISREKETQYVYLQKILELVDTGILSYDFESGDIHWMNESLKKMLGIPYLKTLHSLEKRDPQLYQEILSLRSGESRIIPLQKDKQVLKFVLSATAFQTDGRINKLLAFQNVNEALDETEAKAWQKLLSVMTHEIMNSVAPISSLADTLKHRLEHVSLQEKNSNSALEDLEVGISTIKRRSEGLLKFAETYRNLNKITQPNLKKIGAGDLFENLHQLMLPTLERRNIEMEIVLKDPRMEFDVDVNLLEQVMINLLVNAMDAVKEKEHPRIILSAAKENNKTILKVADNGSGIAPELLDKIFIPFFSTKKSGSGIGLSLCKQIMLLHKGSIQVQSVEGEGTVFTLSF